MNPERDAYLDYLARCQQAFRPFAPINLPDFFKGRRDHIATLQAELSRPGRHVAVYGERGVGKTSLATLAYFFAGFDDEKSAFIRCDAHSTYETIFGHALQHAGVSYLPNGEEASTGLSAGVVLGGGSVSRSKGRVSTSRALDSMRTVSPTTLLRVFGNRRGLIIIDEYDRVTDVHTHVRLAETLKHFSDAASETKIIVVGVADTLANLIGEHVSLTRCLGQLRLGRMTEEELDEIVATGGHRCGAVFKDNIRRRIIGLSDGFPYYTHLLGLLCSEEAGRILQDNPGASVVVAEREYERALRKAIEMAEGTLRDQYQTAIVTVKRKTDMYKNVLWGIAFASDTEVQVRDIVANISVLTGERHKPESLNNCLGKLVKQDRRNILTRVRPGYYRFTNPLMRAFVRLILEDHNIVDENGQMQFPWIRST